MRTEHRVLSGDARDLSAIHDASVALVVTSPPYPMIQLWDELFSKLAPESQIALDAEDGNVAFEAQHRALDQIWTELPRVLAPGGIVCLNIGDATRTVGGRFQLYPNHSRIVTAFQALGFDVLPDILWRKPTNAPNKFMGSGMLPAGAYVTYEHEYILVLRWGAKREFRSAAEKEQRRRSAFFWEERNLWFSDLWSDLRGTTQILEAPEARSRSAAFPFELAYRLIQMYALQEDLVLDPFLGTGTTAAAALASGRSSVGVEYDPGLLPIIEATLKRGPELGRQRAEERLRDHLAFVEQRREAGKEPRHENEPYGFAVTTKQEGALEFVAPVALEAISKGSWQGELQRVKLPADEVEENLPFGNS